MDGRRGVLDVPVSGSLTVGGGAACPRVTPLHWSWINLATWSRNRGLMSLRSRNL